MLEIRHPNMSTTTSTQEAYNQIYRKSGILLRDSFYLWIIHILKPRTGSRLLDISCGQGKLVILAKEQGISTIGMDFSEAALMKGRDDSPESCWVVSDGERLPLPIESIDYVTHIGSLEHYVNPEAGMKEIARILKPEGVACILLPNSYGLFGNIKHVWQTGDIYDDGQPLQRYNTQRGWYNLLLKNGLKPVKVLKYEREWPRTWVDLVWYLLRPLKIARLFIAFFIPLNLANCLVYLCLPIYQKR